MLLLYGLSLLFIFGLSGLGLIISNYSSTMQQAMFMIFFIIIVFILMCGIFTPISSMPEWARAISLFDPFTYFAEIMRMIYLKGSTFRDILPLRLPAPGLLRGHHRLGRPQLQKARLIPDLL